MHVVAPVRRRGLALDDRGEAARDRLDGRERVVHLVPDDANEALESLALLFAQRLAEVRQHEQLVREPALTERAAPDLPPADTSGERGVDHARRVPLEAILHAELLP